MAYSPFAIETPLLSFRDRMPDGSPSHHDVPYAFKAWALKSAVENAGARILLWADASIVPIRNIEPLWEQIESDGYWIERNGWSNYEWTAETAYSDLGVTSEENRKIPHVVATAFGLNLDSEIGRAAYDEFLRLAQTRAFCGPWWNTGHPETSHLPNNGRAGKCGGPDVRGHRHDQTALSVIAWKLGMKLTDPPDVFAYRGGETESTILVADNNY